MSGKGSGANLLTPAREAGGYGIIKDFGCATVAGLDPVFTEGKVLLRDGSIVRLIDSDFDTIGPSANGSITDADTTRVFLSQSTRLPYATLTGTKTDPDDVWLCDLVASTNITEVYPGEWYDSQTIQLGRITVSSTGDLIQYRYTGKPRYLYDAGLSITTSLASDTGVLSFQKLSSLTGSGATTTELFTLALPTQSADLDVRGNLIRTNLVGSAIKILRPGDIIVVECTDGTSGGGAGDVFITVGGYVGPVAA
jgi:hypothetical protein